MMAEDGEQHTKFLALYPDVLKRLETISIRTSDNIRTIGAGVVLFCWGLLSADKGLPLLIVTTHRKWILWTAMTAIAGLLFDLLQGYANYWVSNRLRLQMERERKDSLGFDYRGAVYRMQTVFFVAKLVTVPCSCASLLALLWLAAR